ncbi:MAG: response regulator [Saprospiraceae bacterium]
MTNATILIIEDNEELRENLEETLEIIGYKVITAADGQEGIRKALDFPPDLILCDVMMPKLDGYGVLNILSQKPATSDIPFIFLTAKTERADWRRGMNLGADDYITKPFYKDELLGVISAKLKKSQRLRERFNNPADGWNAFITATAGKDAMLQLTNEQQQKHLKKKEFLFQEGTYPRFLYYVRSGQIKLIKTSDYGKEYIVETCSAGSFIGYTASIGQQPYSFAAVALEPSVVTLIPKDEFLRLLYSDRDVAVQLIRVLSKNVVAKEEQLLQLAYSSVRKRVANALLALNEKQSATSIHILRDDLAGMVGTARETVIRLLSEFKSDGYIEVENGLITIIKADKLAGMPE